MTGHVVVYGGSDDQCPARLVVVDGGSRWHCWHDAGTSRTAAGETRSTKCCWCGQSRVVYPVTATVLPTPHGPHEVK